MRLGLDDLVIDQTLLMKMSCPPVAPGSSFTQKLAVHSAVGLCMKLKVLLVPMVTLRLLVAPSQEKALSILPATPLVTPKSTVPSPAVPRCSCRRHP